MNFEKWDERIERDLIWRRNEHDRRWDRNENYVRSKYEGRLHNNLVRQFEKIVYNRLVNRSGVIKVTSDDTEFQRNAQELSVVANALSRMTGLKENLRQATYLSTYSMGWLEVGHPYAGFSLDPKRYAPIQKNVLDPSTMESVYEEVSPEELIQRGVDIEQIDFLQYNPEEFLTDIESKPEPVFNDAGIGFPYLSYVDGKHVVTPKKIKDFNDADYFARLRALSKDELEIVAPGIKPDIVMPYEYQKLFPDVDFDFIDQVYLIVECWVKRNRRNSNLNNWFAAWIFGEPDKVLRDLKNPWGGMVPLTPVPVSKMGKALDRTLVDDLIRIAEMYSISLKSIDQDMMESLNPKIILGPGMDMHKNEVKKLLNPSYKGAVKVEGANPDGINVERGPGLSQDKLRYINFLRQIAQQQTSTSELDAAQPIKKITARQTQALLDASNSVIDGMRELVSEAGAEVIMKLIFVLSMFHGEKKREFKYGMNTVIFDPSKYDFANSAIYRIELTQLGPNVGPEEVLTMVQALRAITMSPELSAQFDWNVIARHLALVLKWSDDSVKQLQEELGGMEMGGLEELLGGGGMTGPVPEGVPNVGRGPRDQSASVERPETQQLTGALER